MALQAHRIELTDDAATKGQAERHVLAANAPGFATMAIRPRAIVGPDDKVLLPRVLRRVDGLAFSDLQACTGFPLQDGDAQT